MKINVKKETEVDIKTLHISAGVRYWEDATVNGVEDNEGNLIPCRNGKNWEPIVDVDTGVIIDWPSGTTADIHYKVCDAGTYKLCDADGNIVIEHDGYVPKIACPAENGYGDYIIMEVDADGKIANWRFTTYGFNDAEQIKTMQPKFFNSRVELLPGDFAIGETDVKNEPMFFNCSWDYALANGGPITKSFLSQVPIGWTEDVVFDSRVHMLMPGWYPAIPGFHHDDVPRPEIPVGQHFITAGQPNYDNPSYRSEHIIGLVNGDICPTVFALGGCEMPAVSEGELIYRKWHNEVTSLLEQGKLESYSAPSNRLIYFDCDTFHTGTKAISNGWRWFGRISRNTDRVKKITNEIRHQVQVYLEFPMEGW